MELVGCLQTSVTNNHLFALRKVLEEGRSQEVALFFFKHKRHGNDTHTPYLSDVCCLLYLTCLMCAARFTLPV